MTRVSINCLLLVLYSKCLRAPAFNINKNDFDVSNGLNVFMANYRPFEYFDESS